MRVLVRFNEDYIVMNVTYIDNRSDIGLLDDEGNDSGKSLEYENTIYLSDHRVVEDRDEFYVLLPKSVDVMDLLREAFTTGMLDLSKYGEYTFCNPDLNDITDIWRLINTFRSEAPKSMLESMKEV